MNNPDFDAGTMTTYRRQDGEPIDVYDFVLHAEFFESDDEPNELVVETWTRTSIGMVTIPLPPELDEDE